MSPVLITAALIIEQDKILLVQNKKDPKKAYGFPGGLGAFKKTSNPDEAVIEEVEGDTGCKFHGSFFTYHYRNEGTPFLTLFYIGSITGNPKPVCSNIVDVRYFTLEEARQMELAYEHNLILEKFLLRKNSL